jgi:hypothetical protein
VVGEPGDLAVTSLDPDDDEEHVEPDDMDSEIPAAPAPHSIVVRNHAFRFETPGGGWLALRVSGRRPAS